MHLSMILTITDRGRHGRDCMVVGFSTTYAVSTFVSSNPTRAIQHYVIKFVSDLLQVSGFLRVLRFPPPIKLKYC